MRLFDVQVPFFVPVWRRVAVVAACLGWAALEGWNGAWPWAFLFVAIAVYLFRELFLVFDPKGGDE